MKVSFAVMMLLSGLVVTMLTVNNKAQGQPTVLSSKKQESAFFCNLKGLTAEQRKRQTEIAGLLRPAIKSIRELPDGFEFEFAPEPSLYQALVEFTPMERACCPFFDISIRLDREGGDLCWQLTGREGVKTFIKSEFSSWFKAHSGS